MNLRSIITTSAAVAITLSAAAPFAASAQSMTTGAHPIFRTRQDASSTPGTFRERFASSTRPLAGRLASTSAARQARRVTHQNHILAKAEDRATKEIDRRIGVLQSFETRISNVKMSDTAKSELQTTMQNQISLLLSLKNRIASTTSTTTMRDAISSIKSSYRTFALVMPQSAITAAADRVNQIVSQMNELVTKIDSRLGTNPDATSAAALADMKAKLTDAITQAQAAVTEVNALTPDNGNQTQFQANRTALQDAHKKLQAAQQDLVAARKDAGAIAKALGAAQPTNTSTTTNQ